MPWAYVAEKHSGVGEYDLRLSWGGCVRGWEDSCWQIFLGAGYLMVGSVATTGGPPFKWEFPETPTSLLQMWCQRQSILVCNVFFFLLHLLFRLNSCFKQEYQHLRVFPMLVPWHRRLCGLIRWHINDNNESWALSFHYLETEDMWYKNKQKPQVK